MVFTKHLCPLPAEAGDVIDGSRPRQAEKNEIKSIYNTDNFIDPNWMRIRKGQRKSEYE